MKCALVHASRAHFATSHCSIRSEDNDTLESTHKAHLGYYNADMSA